MTIKSTNGVVRKRGIRASKVKLYKALSNANIKTQGALADRIADLENSDTSPTSLVSRIFREQAVDPKSLERVARALGVEAHTLYLTAADIQNPLIPAHQQSELKTQTASLSSDTIDADSSNSLAEEPPFERAPSKTQKQVENINPATKLLPSQNENATQQRAHHRQLIVKSLWVIGFSIVLIAIVVLAPTKNPQPEKSSENSLIKQASHSKNISIALLNNDDFPSDTFASEIIGTSNNQIAFTEVDISLDLIDKPPWQLAKSLAADYLLQAELFKKGRHHGLLVNLVNQESTTAISSLVWSGDLIPTSQQRFIKSLSKEINKQLTTDVDPTRPENVLSKEAILAYLTGKALLDKPWTEENVASAQTYFMRALQKNEQFIEARAGLCSTWSKLSLVRFDKKYLDSAEIECNKINNTTQKNIEALSAFGELQRRRNHLNEAITAYTTALSINANHIDSKIGLAESYAAQANQTHDPNLYQEALSVLNHNLTKQTVFWRIPYTTGRIYYLMGETDKAIASFEESLAIDLNFSNANNLAVMHFCYGDLNKAWDVFSLAKTISGSDPRIDYQIGSIYLFNRDFDHAIDSMKSYLQTTYYHGGDGQTDALMGIAESYRNKGEAETAVEFYRKVIVQTENDKLQGDSSKTNAAKSLYAKIATATLTGSMSAESSQHYKASTKTLLQESTDPSTLTWLMLSYNLLNEEQPALELYRQLANTCSGYVAYPGLEKYAHMD
ncbi:tetratricopeptide repeat protein [Halioxenophilus sp. WMMB6]|uniref:tetratricopeptide repeat protein n=1 Tax=Halioxenophilus sp. WMMB6 TaxID=3073815 RepID=UPI00295E72B9|nr:tetratricopeptide repeat protein [Halioxenophilus sp. WMMB6]